MSSTIIVEVNGRTARAASTQATVIACSKAKPPIPVRGRTVKLRSVDTRLLAVKATGPQTTWTLECTVHYCVV